MSMKEDFKKFAMRGNVMDMAVGVIIGGAFGKIVSSLVNDVVMPPLGMRLARWIFPICLSASTARNMLRWRQQKRLVRLCSPMAASLIPYWIF